MLVARARRDGDSREDSREKLPRYRAAGVPEAWIVDRFKRHVYAESAGAAPSVLTSGRLESTVIRGFWLDVDWLFLPKLPSVLKCLAQIRV